MRWPDGPHDQMTLTCLSQCVCVWVCGRRCCCSALDTFYPFKKHFYRRALLSNRFSISWRKRKFYILRPTTSTQISVMHISFSSFYMQKNKIITKCIIEAYQRFVSLDLLASQIQIIKIYTYNTQFQGPHLVDWLTESVLQNDKNCFIFFFGFFFCVDFFWVFWTFWQEYKRLARAHVSAWILRCF